MKYIISILLSVFILSLIPLKSQVLIDDTLAVAAVRNAYKTSPSTLEFDVYIQRTSDLWRYYANSTFQFEFANMPDFDYTKLSLDLIPQTSELPLVLPGGRPYRIYTGTLKDRIQIIVLGPETLNDALLIPSDMSVKIGRFRLSTRDGSPIEENIYWKRPTNYYQAVAFKYVEGDPVPIEILDVQSDDNIEMGDLSITLVSYKDDPTKPPATSLDYFFARYIGNLKVELWFKTHSEYKTKGFIIKRAVRVPSSDMNLEDIPDAAFTVTVADWNDPKFTSMLTGLNTSPTGKEYGIITDDIEFRGVEYIYRLYYQDENDRIIKLATRLVPVPNAVIEFAQADPNPFVSETKVRYFVRDDVRLSCYVYDRAGKQIATLRDNATNELLEARITPRGWHETYFKASEITSQGSYDIVFIAYPINDPGVELSRAIVKVLYVRSK